jgi:hypothetical protein
MTTENSNPKNDAFREFGIIILCLATLIVAVTPMPEPYRSLILCGFFVAWSFLITQERYRGPLTIFKMLFATFLFACFLAYAKIFGLFEGF